jgi:hypothetical protein
MRHQPKHPKSRRQRVDPFVKAERASVEWEAWEHMHQEAEEQTLLEDVRTGRAFAKDEPINDPQWHEDAPCGR